MSESKTKLYHTYPGEPPFECSTGDMTGEGFEITVDKRTHELVIPKEGETEESVTVIVRPKGGRPAAAVTAAVDVLGDCVVMEVFERERCLPDSYSPATWRNTLPADDSGRVGLGLTLDDGHVLRLSLDPHSAQSIAETVDFWLRRRGRAAELSERQAAEDLARAAKRGVERSRPECLGPIEYRARQPCECHVPEAERRFRQDPALLPECVPCWARGCLGRATSAGGAGPS